MCVYLREHCWQCNMQRSVYHLPGVPATDTSLTSSFGVVNSSGTLCRTILFSTDSSLYWSDWRKPATKCVRVVSVRAEIWRQDLPHARQECRPAGTRRAMQRTCVRAQCVTALPVPVQMFSKFVDERVARPHNCGGASDLWFVRSLYGPI